jgi:hypothetical protein
MKHYQQTISCGICERTFVVDILSWGSPHQSVEAVTCLHCVPEPEKLLGENVIETLKYDVPTGIVRAPQPTVENSDEVQK